MCLLITTLKRRQSVFLQSPGFPLARYGSVFSYPGSSRLIPGVRSRHVNSIKLPAKLSAFPYLLLFLVITGMISFFVGPTCPTGWVLANGATVSSLGESAKLYTYIGTTYGVAGQLPDMTTAGRFIRSTGGNAATLGTQQADVFKSHIHSIVTESIGPDHEGPIFRTGNPYPGSGASSNSNAVTNATGSIETRPINYAMTPCVKY